MFYFLWVIYEVISTKLDQNAGEVKLKLQSLFYVKNA